VVTYRPVDKICPLCGTATKAVLPVSGFSNGATFDGQPVGLIVAPQPLVECPKDGFIFLKNHFPEQEIDRLRSLISSDDFRSLTGESTHFRAAWLAERNGASCNEVINHLLHATWTASSHTAYGRYA
jgi:hypothetical protein